MAKWLILFFFLLFKNYFFFFFSSSSSDIYVEMDVSNLELSLNAA